MHRRHTLAALVLPLFAAGCQHVPQAPASSPSVTEMLSGNTLMVGNKFGMSYVYFDPAGTLLNWAGHSDVTTGTWRDAGDSVCTTSAPSAEGRVFREHCLGLAGKKPGDAWTGDDARNGRITFRLVRGKMERR